LTESEKKAFQEISDFTDKTNDGFVSKGESVISEINEYERHIAGYFTLAISFIIGGMLSSQLTGDIAQETLAARVLFSAAISIALLSALILFLEYIITFRYFGKWQRVYREIILHINEHNWNAPDDLNTWIDTKQKTIKTKPTRVIQIVEVILIALAFLLLIGWLIEKMFNPDFPDWPLHLWRAWRWW
jgi:hypothetical protein